MIVKYIGHNPNYEQYRGKEVQFSITAPDTMEALDQLRELKEAYTGERQFEFFVTVKETRRQIFVTLSELTFE